MSYLVLEDFKLSENFWLSEFQCNNPKKNPKEILIANGDDISKLQKIRDYFDKPLTICVAYRNPIHNKNVGGDPNSNHTRGQAYDIKIGKNDGSMPEVESSLMAYIGDGIMVNSGILNGIDNKEEAIKKMNDYFEEKGIGTREVNYRLQDWVFSRQRFWGEPIPMIYCEYCGWVPVPEKDLPVELPDVVQYEPTATGESPLALIEEFVNTTCPKCGKPAKRETDTMPNWAGSSWYWLRYMDPKNDKEFVMF